MAEIKNNTIIMTQGDTLIVRIAIQNVDGTAYTPIEGDSLRFAMKKNYSDPQPIIIKTIPTDTMELVLDPADTKGLQAGAANGRYKYDIELTRADGSVNTVIPRSDIVILEEVY